MEKAVGSLKHTFNALDLAWTKASGSSGMLGTRGARRTHGALDINNRSTRGGASLAGGKALRLGRHFQFTALDSKNQQLREDEGKGRRPSRRRSPHVKYVLSIRSAHSPLYFDWVVLNTSDKAGRSTRLWWGSGVRL